MKKFLALLLIFGMLAALVACSWTPDMVGESWVLEHVLATDEAGNTYVAYASAAFLSEHAGEYPDAKEIAFALRAKDGKIEIKNTATGDVFLGIYEEGEEINPEQTAFSLVFGKNKGQAVAELYVDPETEKTERLLYVSLGGYVMVFTAK